MASVALLATHITGHRVVVLLLGETGIVHWLIVVLVSLGSFTIALLVIIVFLVQLVVGQGVSCSGNCLGVSVRCQ